MNTDRRELNSDGEDMGARLRKIIGLKLLVLFFVLITVSDARAYFELIEIQGTSYNLHVLEQGDFSQAIKVINRAKEFSSKFQKNIAEPIDNCSFMIDLPVGLNAFTMPNHSYGGYCETKSGQGIKVKNMIVCGDLRVGNFKSQLIDNPPSGPPEINTLAAFVVANCWGEQFHGR